MFSNTSQVGSCYSQLGQTPIMCIHVFDVKFLNSLKIN